MNRLLTISLLSLLLTARLMAQPDLAGNPAGAMAVMPPILQQMLPAETGNPALLYWQAFAAYRDVAPDARAQWDAFDNAHRNMTDAVTRDALDKCFGGGAFDHCQLLLHRADTSSTTPDWGIETTQGLFAELPHLASLRKAQRLLLWHARYQLLRDKTDDGVAELIEAFRLARHCSPGGDGMLISLLVEKDMERHAVNVAALLVPRLTPEQLRRLAGALAVLPAGGTLPRAVAQEKQLVLTTLAQCAKAYAATARDPQQREQLVAFFTANLGHAEMRWIFDYLDDPTVAAGVSAQYDRLIELLTLPPSAIPTALATHQARMQTDPRAFVLKAQQLIDGLPLNADRDAFRVEGMAWANRANPAFAKRFDALVREQNGVALVITGILMPHLETVFTRITETDTDQALLRAGILVQQQNPDVLAHIADPATPRPFTYQQEGKGFRLTSAVSWGGAAGAISLRFGE